MRSILLVLSFVIAAACASGPRAVNVAAVRNEIADQIAAESGDRKIHSMGRVRADQAVVYTTKPDGTKQEETWAKADGRWKLEQSTVIASGK